MNKTKIVQCSASHTSFFHNTCYVSGTVADLRPRAYLALCKQPVCAALHTQQTAVISNATCVSTTPATLSLLPTSGLVALCKGHAKELLRHPQGADVMIDLYDVASTHLRNAMVRGGGCSQVYPCDGMHCEVWMWVWVCAHGFVHVHTCVCVCVSLRACCFRRLEF